MANKNILLIEPGYKNKYPPLGLMKIAQYHGPRGKRDNVRFIKGEQPEVEKTAWDRIYVTTLFSFEFSKISRSIDFAICTIASWRSRDGVECDSSKVCSARRRQSPCSSTTSPKNCIQMTGLECRSKTSSLTTASWSRSTTNIPYTTLTSHTPRVAVSESAVFAECQNWRAIKETLNQSAQLSKVWTSSMALRKT